MTNNDQHIIQIKGLGIGYRSPGQHVIYDNINLTARKGELIALIGRNGTGKSTLLRTLVKLQQKINGSIYIHNEEIEHSTGLEMAKRVSYVSTEIVHADNLKVYDLVALGRFPYTNWLGKIKDHDRCMIEQALEMVDMKSFAEKNIQEVSDGERQKIMIARALAQDTEILILDEPTAFLDLPNKYEVVSLLGYLAREKNKCIIFSSHDLNITIREADMIWMMMDDEIKTGAPEDMIISGMFGDMFKDSNLNFNIHNGDFFIPKKTEQSIYLYGEGIYKHWTTHALERAGYVAVEQQETPERLSIIHKGKQVIWAYENKKEKKEFYDLYNLLLFLSRKKL